MVSKKGDKVIPAPFARRPAPSREGGKPVVARKAAVDPGLVGEVRPKKDGRKRSKKKWFGKLTFIFAVLIPTLITALYYIFIAADQYRVETRFAVRSTAPVDGSSLLSSLGLGVGGTAAADTYMVVEYIHSREILKRIDEKIGLRQRYVRPENDLYAALPKDATFEDFVEYWRWMVEVGLDRTSHIVTIDAYAFTPEDARDISDAILKESERMINEISEQARRDAVAYAEKEVAKAEQRLREIRQRFLQFRNTTQQLDPTKQAQVQVVLIGKLEEQLVELKTKLSEARSYLSPNAPTVVFLKNRINALKEQIANERRKLGDKKPIPQPKKDKEKASLSLTLSEYEALVVEREFAEKLYLTALSGLEQARLLANRQQRYLATFVRPYLPDEALYPKRIRNTIFVFLAMSLVWGLGMLMLQSVRDRI